MPSPHAADLELAARLQRRDEAAAQRLLREHGPQMLGYARRMLGSADTAEDAFQEAVLAALAAIGSYDGRVSLRAWLYGILRHKIYDTLRRAGREILVSNDDPELDRFRESGHWRRDVNISPWDEGKEILRVVRRCIEDLPHNQREVLIMRTMKGLSSQEAASALELSDANLRQILHRARQSVRRCAEGKLGDLG